MPVFVLRKTQSCFGLTHPSREVARKGTSRPSSAKPCQVSMAVSEVLGVCFAAQLLQLYRVTNSGDVQPPQSPPFWPGAPLIPRNSLVGQILMFRRPGQPSTVILYDIYADQTRGSAPASNRFCPMSCHLPSAWERCSVSC